MDCDSRKLIYCFVCRGCGEKYIGLRGDVIRNRVRVHKQQILHADKRMLGMSEHISKCSQNYSPNFKMIPFLKLNLIMRISEKTWNLIFLGASNPN